MMELQINNKYKISSDKYNFVLHEKVLVKRKQKDKSEIVYEEEYQVVGYYPDIETLAKKIMNIEVSESTVKSMNELVELIEKESEKISNKLSMILEVDNEN